MPKKIKVKPIYDNIEFDSQEEIEFYCWCKELKDNNIIESFVYHPESLELLSKKTISESVIGKNGKNKVSTRTLLREHVYTPDFVLTIRDINKDYFKNIAEFQLEHPFYMTPDKNYYFAWIDVKGGFNDYGGDRVFAINQKLVFDKHDVFINKVVLRDKINKAKEIIKEGLFRKTFVPSAVAYGKRGELFKRFEGCKIGFNS